MKRVGTKMSHRLVGRRLPRGGNEASPYLTDNGMIRRTAEGDGPNCGRCRTVTLRKAKRTIAMASAESRTTGHPRPETTTDTSAGPRGWQGGGEYWICLACMDAFIEGNGN